MIIFKTAPLLVSFLFLSLLSKAQPGEYKTDWKKVEDFEKKGLSRSALLQVIKIFDAAIKDRNEAQQVKAAMYQMKYRNLVEEDNRENNIFYLDTLISKSVAPSKNILQSMQAELFLSYRQNNRYRLYDRTKMLDEKSNDVTTWSIDKLNATITGLYKSSLSNEQVLKNTPLNGLDAIIAKGVNTRNLRPTLYDFLAHRALAYFMSSENDVTSPSYKFILNDEKIFAPIKTFINTKFTTRDTGSLYYNAILLLQDILGFHLKDASPEALVDADLLRLSFAYEHGVFTNKDKFYEDALKKIEETYNHPSSAQAMYLRAQMYYNQGQQYDPFTKRELQFEIKKAKELLESVAAKFPKSEGSINAMNLLNQLQQPVLELETEKVNIPLLPFRSLVKYKNIRTVYLRLIKTDREEIKNIEKEGYEKIWPSMTALKPIKSWSISLPDAQDFQQHSTEIKVDPLSNGIYFLMASIKQDFSQAQNIITRQVIYISNISYIYNNNNQLFVLDRNNGQPLPNATIQLWDKKYNYTSRSYEDIKSAGYTTDKNGMATIKINERSNNILQVKYKNDELFMNDGYYSYSYNNYNRPASKRTFLFSDRSIYRPGQTVFFKGIVVNTDSGNKKSNIISNYSTTLILFDVNYQKVAGIKLRSNEYGSYSGSFTLPAGVLNGQFHITDSATNSTLAFSVEEYKRPKFYVDIEKPAGTYRVNDSIVIKGNAKAYAGNTIGGAKVTYRVVRKMRYPLWWGGYRKIWPPYGNSEAMEITNGETVTGVNGDFVIAFKAIPDETVEKINQPTFYYELSADITDINGETRSDITTVAVAYQALQLNIIAPDKMAADSFRTVKVSSTNMNGIFEKVTVNFQVYKLQSRGKIFRTRYWNMPDQYIMSREEFYASFPYDPYMDEDQVAKWPVGQKIIDINDTTSSTNLFSIPTIPSPGWYKIITTSKDKYGELVKAEKFIQLTSNLSPSITDPVIVNIDNKTAQPGQKVSYTISTGFSSVWLINNIRNVNNPGLIDYKTIVSTIPYKDQIQIKEDDRGGLMLNYVFIQHNRVYSGSEYIAVPWNNKELAISYETFRDKTLPGSE
ncbi:MAG TPA: MG2 domain-containing protein, partial [Ferruginibacter sp.]|nr:MG2 domain-containing protein [Ferruginibacter sp.]